MSSSFNNPDMFPSSSQGDPPSPEAPPYSPISPVVPELPSLNRPPKAPRPNYMDAAPPPEPINESSNPDAIALRAAISVLQVQRERALQDLQVLEQQRNVAEANPEEFAKALAEGKVRAREPQGILGAPGNEASEGSESEDANETKSKRKKASKRDEKHPSGPNFGQIPTPQNIVRCPPINWSKYHVAGEALDKLHQEQQQRPDPGLPFRDPSARPPEHQIAAPYSPWKDKLSEGSARPRNEPKKG